MYKFPGSRPSHLQPDSGSDDHALPQVADANHEAKVVVSDSDDGLATEDERLRPTVGLSRLHEDTTWGAGEEG